MDWFEKLTGFHETGYADTRAKFEVDGCHLKSLVNGKSYGIGELELVSLQALRERVKFAGGLPGRLKVSVVTGDVRHMHQSPENAGALFQVASQFNLLEMIGPEVTPEHGVTRYQHDHTQGPACAMAAGAATIYRNYFTPGGHFAVGQQRHDPSSLQITYDCSVMMIPPEGPVIDAHNCKRLGWRHRSSSNDTQQRVVTDGKHESPGKACCRSSAECQAKMMDNALQSSCTTSPDRDNIVSEPLCKDLPEAMRHLTNKPPCDHSYRFASARQIGNLAKVATVNSAREHPAQRTICRRHLRTDSQNYRVR